MASRKTWVHLGLIATCGLALAVAWEYHGEFIAPLRQREAETQREIADLSERLADARTTMAGIQAQEKDADRVRSELERLREELPKGAAMVALPEMVKGHFAKSGINVPLIRLNTTQDCPDLPGYAHGYWSVALPIGDAGPKVTAMLLAVAELEQRDPFLRVLEFAIRTDPENPGGRMGSLNLGTVIRK
jgi:hypothetical protein